MISLPVFYERLFAAYGSQGWWPLPGSAGRKGFDSRGYHPGDYRQPRSALGRFEIVMGAILTQNTAWTNAEKALIRLRAAGIRLPADVRACRPARLAGLIRASGYYNQKARKLKGIAALFAGPAAGAPARDVLLGQWGIGPETADSILLYAYRQPLFVVDAYTRRILTRIGLLAGTESYAQIQGIFHVALPERHELFNEFHALLVEHAKRHCRATPACEGCPVPACAWRDSRRGKPADSRRGTPADSRRGKPADSRRGTPADSRRGTPADSRRGTPADSRRGTPADSRRGTPADSRAT